ncbi:hypothetical protein [Clostridium sp.]|uniref:hypothetical protein n=1 Tax=Clostridium sp. TaxID=1506 RepID=UPI002639AEB5|nr:hypothetical protein [Clostridium sp.]
MDMTKEAIKKLIDEQFDGSYNKCARSLDLVPSTVWRIANGNSKAGIKAITKVMEYCNDKDISYEKYVYLS